MKKYLSILFGVALMSLVSCEDVPAPYHLFEGDNTEAETSIYYTSTNLNSNWTLLAINGLSQPWSQGSSYAQASSSQKWDGTNRSNKEVEGYLISPKFNTVAKSGKVKIDFQHCINYASYDSEYANHIGLYISKDYDGNTENFASATWEKISFTLADGVVNSSWALVGSGDIPLPAEYVNCPNVHVAFYFYGPAAGSATWELANFTIQEGEATGLPVEVAIEKTTNSVTFNVAGTTAGAAALSVGVDELSLVADEMYNDVTLAEGVSMSFANTVGNVPIYKAPEGKSAYLRVYGGNVITLNTPKPVARVQFDCLEGYVGSDDLTAVSKDGVLSITVGKKDAKEEELRFTKVTLYYAE